LLKTAPDVARRHRRPWRNASRRCARRKLLPVPSTPHKATSRWRKGGASGSASMASTLPAQQVQALDRSRLRGAGGVPGSGHAAAASADLATMPPMACTHSVTPGASRAITGRPVSPASMTTSGTSETGPETGKRKASTVPESRAISAASSISVRTSIRAAAGLRWISVLTKAPHGLRRHIGAEQHQEAAHRAPGHRRLEGGQRQMGTAERQGRAEIGDGRRARGSPS
jgi:hypothetical protein